eukprot:3172314-Amphidinium_carterae.1
MNPSTKGCGWMRLDRLAKGPKQTGGGPSKPYQMTKPEAQSAQSSSKARKNASSQGQAQTRSALVALSHRVGAPHQVLQTHAAAKRSPKIPYPRQPMGGLILPCQRVASWAQYMRDSARAPELQCESDQVQAEKSPSTPCQRRAVWTQVLQAYELEAKTRLRSFHKEVRPIQDTRATAGTQESLSTQGRASTAKIQATASQMKAMTTLHNQTTSMTPRVWSL